MHVYATTVKEIEAMNVKEDHRGGRGATWEMLEG